MRDLKLKFVMLEKKGQVLDDQVLKPKVGQIGGWLLPRCMWCDSFEHLQRECPHFTEALRNNVIFFKDGQIHSRETELPLETNFDKGGMKVIVDGLTKEQASVKAQQSRYGIELVRDCAGVNINLPSQFDTV